MNAVNAVQETHALVAAINPAQWLKTHEPPRKRGVRDLPLIPLSLSAGIEAIEASNDVLSAIESNPGLRVEIVMAYLLSDNEIGKHARQKILNLARAMDGISED